MRFGPLALALLITVLSPLAQAQNAGLATDEQILLKQVNTDKKALYAQNLGLTEEESAKFWPIYDEYEAKVKPLTDEEAAAILKEKMAIEKEREALKQKYTAKIAKELPSKKALRYAQLETRIQNMLARDLYSIIPLAR
jgi:hypothetical protein